MRRKCARFACHAQKRPGLWSVRTVAGPVPAEPLPQRLSLRDWTSSGAAPAAWPVSSPSPASSLLLKKSDMPGGGTEPPKEPLKQQSAPPDSEAPPAEATAEGTHRASMSRDVASRRPVPKKRKAPSPKAPTDQSQAQTTIRGSTEVSDFDAAPLAKEVTAELLTGSGAAPPVPKRGTAKKTKTTQHLPGGGTEPAKEPLNEKSAPPDTEAPPAQATAEGSHETSISRDVASRRPVPKKTKVPSRKVVSDESHAATTNRGNTTVNDSDATPLAKEATTELLTGSAAAPSVPKRATAKKTKTVQHLPSGVDCGGSKGRVPTVTARRKFRSPSESSVTAGAEKPRARRRRRSSSASSATTQGGKHGRRSSRTRRRSRSTAGGKDRSGRNRRRTRSSGGGRRRSSSRRRAPSSCSGSSRASRRHRRRRSRPETSCSSGGSAHGKRMGKRRRRSKSLSSGSTSTAKSRNKTRRSGTRASRPGRRRAVKK